jgi:chemotaxis protein MotB
MAKEQKSIIIVKKVVKGHHGHHGGAWKVAYADFVTAMMAFFMVMWIIGMDESTKSAIEGYFQNPVGFSDGSSTQMSPVNLLGNPPKPAAGIMPIHVVSRQIEEQRFKELAEKIEIELKSEDGLGAIAAQVEIVVTEEGLRIELIEGGEGEMFFALGAADLKPAAERALQIIASQLKTSPAPVVIEGHTDAAGYSRAGFSNWELSADRANAARRAMEKHGLSARRVVEVRGYADRHLRVEEDPLAKSNRRISVLLPFTAPAVPASTGGAGEGARAPAEGPAPAAAPAGDHAS